MKSLRAAWFVVLVALVGATHTWAQSPVRPATAVPVSTSVQKSADAGNPIEALILLDDADELAVQASRANTAKALHALTAVEYTQHLAERQALLGRLTQQFAANVAGTDLQVIKVYSALPVLHVRIFSKDALARITAHPKVRSVDENKVSRRFLSQSLPLIRQPQAANLGYLGAGTTVAVLDTGVDYTRSAFGSCSSPGGACKVVFAQDFAPNDGVLDDDGHGTNVAGIVLGVAPGARIAALDVFRTDGSAYDNDLVSAIEWSIISKSIYNIAAINMSLGGGRHFSPISPTDSFGITIQNAVNAGIVVVVASGNDAYTGSIAWPAAYSNVLSVGAIYDANVGPKFWQACPDTTTAADRVTCFSNSASFLGMLSPGAEISAAGETQSGTSQAAPHVAGAAAVLRAAFPSESVSSLINRLKQGPGIQDHRNGITKPRLDLMAALGNPAGGFSLGVSKVGTGTGTVTSSPSGINCGATCNANFTPDSTVVLTAMPASGSTFTAWSGACTGAAPTCTVTMNSAKSVSATFTPGDNGSTISVMKTGTGTGTVQSNPAGINCGPVCSAGFTPNSLVLLTAQPTSGSTFAGWSGACSGTATSCWVAASGARNLTATFNSQQSPTQVALTVNRSGTGGGTVTSNPAGINCGTVCSTLFAINSTVSLVTTPNPGSTFVGWSGACSGTGTCTVSMSIARTVTATFSTSAASVSLGDALDNTSLSWTTLGSPPWFGQTATSSDGVDAAQSGAITDLQATSVVTSVVGPGTLRYFWRVSSELGYDYLTFFFNDVEQQGKISGEVNWAQRTWTIPTGTHTLRWTYNKDGSASVGQDRAWLDRVEYVPDVPIFVLTVAKQGTGGGTVVSNPSGINCGSVCSASFTQSTNVTLTATPISGSAFTGWSGACSGTAPTCVVGMTVARTATATFSNTPPPLSLGDALDNTALSWSTSSTAPWAGQTNVTSDGIDAAQSGAISALQTTSVVTAVVGPGELRYFWRVSSEPDFDKLTFYFDDVPQQGAISGEVNWVQQAWTIPVGIHALRWTYSKDGSVTLGQDKAWLDRVEFIPAAPAFVLSVVKQGTGSGTIISTPSGISCGSTCSASFSQDTNVTLNASPASGSTFAGWTGACSGMALSCIVNMGAAKTASANFNIVNVNPLLTVTKSGTGSGTIQSIPSGINCGTTCSAIFSPNANVTLFAQTAPGSTFGGWSGACSGNSTLCTVAMASAREVSAVFNGPAPVVLSVNKAGAGSGTVTSAPAGIDCGTSCSSNFAQGSTVTLTATAAQGSLFSGWSGSCSGASTTCVVGMSSARSVTANFAVQPTTVILTVLKSGSGGGTVSSNPAGINCGSVCAASFNQNSQVVLTAVPASGSTFAGWSGACSGAATSCTVSMNSATSATASFGIPVSNQRLSVFRTGSGTVTGADGAVNCGATGTSCSVLLNALSTVTLTAAPAPGWAFSRWLGACNHSSTTCSVSMSSAQAVIAQFTVGSLGSATDNPSLPWVSGATGPTWFSQNINWWQGGSSAQSGSIAHLQETAIQTTITGPGLLTFRWRVSSQAGFDWLSFRLSGSEQEAISGDSPWLEGSWFIPAGTFVVSWVYQKDAIETRLSDAGWLDAVTFTPGTSFSNASAAVLGSRLPIRRSFGAVNAK